MFCYKLDFLMQLTKITNKTLGTAISLDPSHISRLRRGKRSLPKNSGFLKPMSEYFATLISSQQQHKTLSKVLGQEKDLPLDLKELAAAIASWLTDEDPGNTETAAALDSAISRLGIKIIRDANADVPYPFNPPGKVYYFGIEGKQQAVVRFLTDVANAKKPQTILLYSDEPMDWLFGDVEYTKLWASLLKKIIMVGHQIKIIHTINRNLDEMFNALTKWLPVYMTGAVQPYYCPKVRDELFLHTMFIAPKTAAITVTTSRLNVQNTLNHYHTDKKALASLTDEYIKYLDLCKPLMLIFTPQKSKPFRSIFSKFTANECTAISSTQGLSPITIPDTVIESIAKRTGNAVLSNFLKLNQSNFTQQLAAHKWVELLALPDIKEVKAGRVPVLISDMAESTEVFYTPDEFQQHLTHIVKLLKTQRNYHIAQLSKKSEEQFWMFAKEGQGAMFIKQSFPTTAFTFTEQNISSAVLYYLYDKADKAGKNPDNRRDTISVIETFLGELEK